MIFLYQSNSHKYYMHKVKYKINMITYIIVFLRHFIKQVQPLIDLK